MQNHLYHRPLSNLESEVQTMNDDLLYYVLESTLAFWRSSSTGRD